MDAVQGGEHRPSLTPTVNRNCLSLHNPFSVSLRKTQLLHGNEKAYKGSADQSRPTL